MVRKLSELPPDTTPTATDVVVGRPAGAGANVLFGLPNLLKRLFLADGTELLITTIANGQTLRRSGTNIEGYTPPGTKATMYTRIGGMGSVIQTGVCADLLFEFDGVLDKVTLLADQPGSIVLDVWSDAYPTVPVDADSITASAPLTIANDSQSQNSTLTGWSKNVVKNTRWRLHVDSVTNLTRVEFFAGFTLS